MKLKYNPPADFLKEEIKLGYTISLEMKKVWAVQMDLLQVLLDVCDRHGLRIYADGGTLLGAIRHQGYIPWDDDIDMVMLREDYDKLMELTEEFQNPYFLQNVYTDPHYTHRHAQLRNSETACWSQNEKGCPKRFNQGIFVDIFPADSIPQSPRHFARYYKKEGVARQKFRLVSKLTNAFPEPLYMFFRNKTSFLSDKKRYAEYENVLRSVKAMCHGNVCEISFKHNYPLMQIDDFDEPVLVDFEYMKMPVPQNSHRLLELQYGSDYMTPKQAPTVHGGLNFDVEHSYKEHLV